ncbi:MAG: hypothetical protein ACK5LM_00055 [Lactovum sp.]
MIALLILILFYFIPLIAIVIGIIYFILKRKKEIESEKDILTREDY